ncbi:unnamed protein product [Clonostachys byssicola]|uniref:Cystathionine gamma-synthase n=1 Tax=Clonostachys byssicola TaxID=160290 RepID=A0A9N9UEY4_9HYPO|nr:unnamed protein product [Clonostachys byssicola]
MSSKITTPFGEAVPPAPRHSVTVHMGGWDTVEKYGTDSSAVIAHFKNAYPRMRPHRDIADSATECVDFSTSEKRRDEHGKMPVPQAQISIRVFRAKDTFFAVVFPEAFSKVVFGFWSTPGAGISSRFAEVNLRHRYVLEEISASDTSPQHTRLMFNGSVHKALRERIVWYVNRATRTSDRSAKPSAQDVYLYPTGMASIYKPHTYMLDLYQGTTVLFGMAFMNTLTAFQEYGPGLKFFGHGSDNDLDQLEDFLRDEYAHGRKVQAIWAEFPANPLLVTPDISRLRDLAGKYDVVLAIDDTIGSWANIDITSSADILVTSLTKSFNGYADAIAGSAILNPASAKYAQLKPLFDRHYVPELYNADAKAIEHNSRDYLPRTAKLNANALAIVQYLQACAEDPASAVRRVHHPWANPSRRHYERVMRQDAEDFTPGYGCLFSVELDNMDATQAFYEGLNVHKSVHLGAPFTLAFAYTMCTYKKDLAWAAANGLLPTQIRISAGLEDTEVLLEDFRVAVEAANRYKQLAGL